MIRQINAGAPRYHARCRVEFRQRAGVAQLPRNAKRCPRTPCVTLRLKACDVSNILDNRKRDGLTTIGLNSIGVEIDHCCPPSVLNDINCYVTVVTRI
jgi:hypothetical protein